MTDNQKDSHKSTVERSKDVYHSKAQSNPRITLAMMHPRYWPQWFASWILRLIILLPYPVFMTIGRLLGYIAMAILPRRRHISEQNFKLAFPDMPDEEIHRLTKEHFANCGMGIFETGMAWYWPEWRLKRLVHIDPEELRKARELAESGKGIVVLTCHFVTLELMARIYGTNIKKGVGVYRPNDNPIIEYMQVKGRTRSNLYLVDRKEPRPIVKALMKGLPIWYAPDQDYGKRLPHVFAPFFAVKDAATVTGTAGFAKIRNTVVQPSYSIRLPKFKGYRLVVKDIIRDFPTGDDYQDATTCNHAVESMIMEALPQYMWLHRRFKTTPDDSDRYHNL